MFVFLYALLWGSVEDPDAYIPAIAHFRVAASGAVPAWTPGPCGGAPEIPRASARAAPFDEHPDHPPRREPGREEPDIAAVERRGAPAVVPRIEHGDLAVRSGPAGAPGPPESRCGRWGTTRFAHVQVDA